MLVLLCCHCYSKLDNGGTTLTKQRFVNTKPFITGILIVKFIYKIKKSPYLITIEFSWRWRCENTGAGLEIIQR